MLKGKLNKVARSALAAGLTLLLVASAVPSIQASTTNTDKAIDFAASKTGAPRSEIKVVNEGICNFPLTGKSVWAGKVFYPGGAMVVYVNPSTGAATGTVTDLEKAENEAAKTKYGKLAPKLYERVQSQNDSDLVKVGIWLADPDLTPAHITLQQKYPNLQTIGGRPNTTDQAVLAAYTKDAFAEKAKVYKAASSPIVTLLNDLGSSAIFQSSAAPLVFVTVTKAQLNQLSNRPEITVIYPQDENITPAMTTAVITSSINSNWANGFNGGKGFLYKANQNLVVEAKTTLNVRSGPTTTYAIIGTVNAGEQYAALRYENDWVEIKLNSNTVGWVFMNAGSYAIGKLPGTGQIADVTGSVVNVRSGPDTSYGIVTTVNNGAELIPLESVNGWYHVKLLDGTLGWVSGTYLSLGTVGTSPTNEQVKVAVVEDSGIDFSNAAVSQSKVSSFRTPDYNPSTSVPWHGTAVAGVITSIDRGVPGVAPGAKLLNANSATYSDTDVIAATEWALSNGADILNLSFGGPTGGGNQTLLSRYFDHVAREHFRLPVAAAGNTTNDSTRYVTSPGNGYNVLTVGAIDDAGTGGGSDDTMADFSNYLNPTDGDINPSVDDRQKPDVSAPGAKIATTLPLDGDPDGLTNYRSEVSGTSFATPFVSGLVSNLMEQTPTLRAWPELARAVVMAGAIKEVDGDTKSLRWGEKEGVGTVVGGASKTILSNGRYDVGSWTSTAFPKTYQISLKAGEKLRAVVTWDSQTSANADHSTVTSVLKADIDLRLKSGSTDLTQSTTWNNTSEVIEYTATADGVYTLEVLAPTFQGPSEYVAVAWGIY